MSWRSADRRRERPLAAASEVLSSCWIYSRAMSRFLRLVRLWFEALVAAIRLRRLIRTGDAPIDVWLDRAFAFQVGSTRVAPTQVRAEIRSLLEELEHEPPRTVLEIGTFGGGTTFLFARVATPDALLVTVDADGGPGGALGRLAPLELICRALAGPRQRVVPLLRSDSHRLKTLEAVKRILAGRPLDFLFVDGDHSTEGVRADIALYLPLLRPGGIAAFHDIVDGPPEAVGGVPAVWRELRTQHPSHEHVESWSQGGLGIGVLRIVA